MNHPNLFVHSDGALYNVRRKRVVRERYSGHFASFTGGNPTTLEVRATLRAGPFVWPGGYALAFVMEDGDTLCFPCVRKEYREVSTAIRNTEHGARGNGWRPVALACEGYTDEECTCAHCNTVIWEAKPI